MLEPKGYSKALGFGTFVHCEVEAVHGNRPSTLAQRKNEYLDADDGRAMEQIEFDASLAQAIVPIWKEYWDNAVGIYSNKYLDFIDVEGEWSFPVKGKREYQHVGKRDGYARHTDFQKNFLYELKTATPQQGENYVHRLHLDHQISSNIIALQREGKECSGVIYDIIWKHSLRLKKSETLREFFDRVVEDYRANAATYFERLIVDRMPTHLNEYEDELAAQFKDVDEGVAYRNPGACMTYGSLCPYFTLCMDESTPEFEAEFRKKPRKHTELGGAS